MEYIPLLKCPVCGKCKQISKFEAKILCGDFYGMQTFDCNCTMSAGRRMASAACLTFIRMDELYIMDEKGKYDEM